MITPPLRAVPGLPLGHQGQGDRLGRFGDFPCRFSDRPWVTTRDLPPVMESPKVARRVIKATLAEWRLDDFYDDASVVVSELVTNAIRHGLDRGAEEALRLVVVRFRADLVCMVTDPTDRVPTLREPDYVAESGRGLHIIQAMSRAWGWIPLSGGGKAVWAAFAIA